MKLFDEWKRILLSLPLKCLLPELCVGAVVVMDNVPAHKVKEIEPLIQSKAARVLYQSPPES
ncbi:transposase [Scytonema sp. HK-05]|uniref:transposase n=1 Tax=Scytonema sp. HK-05 TaxID=1137095 RepID=UPI001E626385|nr:transposase [Scytonema sp. HK-05]